MNKTKRIIFVVLGVALLLCVVGVFCIGFRAAPTVGHAMRISELMQPLLDAPNQTMHIGISAELGGTSFALESDIFRVSEDGVSYLAVEQNGSAVYVTGNVLFLENGKAFKIGDAMQNRTGSHETLLPQIKTLYEVLKITSEETDGGTSYSITVTGEQVASLLEAASFGEALPVEEIEKLDLQLTEKNGTLDRIVFSGSADVDRTSAKLNVTLSGFRILAPGDYPIPEAVQQSAATVNPETLFSLTEDLYRLVLAFAPFANLETIDGTLDLTVDCGLLQLDSQVTLSDLKTTSNSQLDPAQLQALPEMLVWLCLEGEIACTRNNDTYVYTLALDQASMKELSRMILPELAQYGGNLTEGSVSIILDAGKVLSMNVSIKGEIRALIAQIPITVGAEFTFG